MNHSEWGFLLLDKPEGPTSFTAVKRAAKALGFSRAGHAGTLDPMATGLLLTGLGRATRLLEHLVGCDKTYRAVIKLGIETDTLDREGAVVRREEVPTPTRAKVESALKPLLGRIEQTPPRHSAVKVDGVALYRRARRGEEFEVPKRVVEITRLEVLSLEGDEIALEIDCSSGTYIRSLARDVGAALGMPASLWALRRTRCGNFSINDATPLGEILEKGVAPLLDPAMMVAGLPRVVLAPEEVALVLHGRAVAAQAPENKPVAVVDEAGGLLALGEVSEGVLRPVKVFG